MTQHSPGPWKAVSERWPGVHDDNTWWRIYQASDAGDLIADVSRTASPTPEQIQSDAANARLIAASPDLLAACEQIVRGWGHQDGVSKAVVMARAAIAKAIGTEA